MSEAQNPVSGSRRKGPSLRRLIKIDAPRGSLRASKQPYGYKQPKSPIQSAWREWFRKGQRAFKHLPAEWQLTYIEATKGTPLMPQDLWLQAFAGRGAAIQTTSGKVVWPYMAKFDVSQSLDILAPDPGDMLARDKNGWVGVPSGTAGKVLTSTGLGQPPIWAFQGANSSWTPVGATSVVGGVLDIKGLDFSGAVQGFLALSQIRVDTDGVYLYLQAYLDDVLQTAGYQFATYGWSADDLERDNNDTSTNRIPIAGASTGAFRLGNRAENQYTAQLFIGVPSLEGIDRTFFLNSASQRQTGLFNFWLGGGVIPAGKAITGFRITPASGNLVSGNLFALKL